MTHEPPSRAEVEGMVVAGVWPHVVYLYPPTGRRVRVQKAANDGEQQLDLPTIIARINAARKVGVEPYAINVTSRTLLKLLLTPDAKLEWL